MTTQTKRLRRAFGVTAAAASLALMLAGCGSSSDDTTQSTPDNTDSNLSTELDTAAYDELIEAGPVADDATVEANTWASNVKKAGVLKVGGTKTSTLFSLQSTDDNKLRGFDAGLSQLLARYILGDAKTELSVVDSSTRETVLQNGTVDAVFATYSITDKRKEQVDFAGPYYVSQQGILVKADNTDINSVDDLAGKNVGVQAGSTGPAVVKEYAPDANVQEFQTDAEIVQAIKQGRVDAYVVDLSLVLGSVAKDPENLKVAGEGFGDEDPYGIGLPKGSDATEFVNAWLKQVEEDGTWAKLWTITIGDRTGVSEVPTPPEIAQ